MIDLENILELEAKATPGPWALVVETAPDMLIMVSMDKLRQMESELKAAREVVIYATNVLRFTPHAVAACYSTKCECFHGPLAESIARYDEARRG